jgi:hypothetical protein
MVGNSRNADFHDRDETLGGAQSRNADFMMVGKACRGAKSGNADFYDDQENPGEEKPAAWLQI